MSAIIGDPSQVMEGMQRYQQAGVEKFIIQWFFQEDIKNLEYLAKSVLLHFNSLAYPTM